MAAQDVQMVIGRAATDKDFRSQLKSDAASALKEYNLSDEERQALSSMPSEDLDQFAGKLEPRISKLATFSPLSGS